MMDRETWLRRILETIRDLADEAYQERIWVRGEGLEVDSSTEAICRLADDYDFAGFIAEAAKKGWVSNEPLAALRGLDAALARSAADDQDRDDAARMRVANGPECEKLPRRRSTRSRHPPPADDFLSPPAQRVRSANRPPLRPARTPFWTTRYCEATRPKPAVEIDDDEFARCLRSHSGGCSDAAHRRPTAPLPAKTRFSGRADHPKIRSTI
jgi:hypothetical protein